ncbi:MAG: rod shape-determining protein RodA [Pseudomonadales bacterium]|nr:rod shape-determining protein RodA [Pseudomonadales bacterium]
MQSKDFLRRLPEHGSPVTQQIRVWQAIHLDGPLLFGLTLLIIIGLFVLYSAANEDMQVVTKQASRIGVGFTVMIVLAQIPPYAYRRWTPWLYCMGIMLLIAVLVTGIDAKGAQRWIAVPGFPRFQPAELMKLAVPMMMSWYLADRTLPPAIRPILASLVMIACPAVLIATQPDLGTSILISCSGIIVLLMAGLAFRYILAGVALAIPAGSALWMTMHDYQRGRVLTFLDPLREPLGAGWNIIQSKTAIGSGGLTGKGWLNGTQSHLDFLPESSTDFVIAVLAEEFGFFGVFGLLIVYAAVVCRGLYIGVQAQDTYNRLLAGSIILTFFVYIFVNIGMVTGILPVVGVPLPMVSFGGTSIVTLMAGFGILMSIHTHRKLVSG